MKFKSILLAVAVASPVRGVAVPPGSSVSEADIADVLLQNDYLLPPLTRQILHEQSEHPPKGQDARTSLQTLLRAFFDGSPTSVPPKSLVPQVQDEPPQRWPQAKRRKIRYGPFRIPATSEKNFFSEYMNVKGMSNKYSFGVKKPCEGECTILSVEADLEHFDGSKATNADGDWLHHTVLLNSGLSVMEPTCGTQLLEIIFMSGNERTTSGYGIPTASVKSGYSMDSNDRFVLTTELMNIDDREKWAWLAVTYEYLDGPQPDYKEGKMVWLTIGPVLCRGANTNENWTPFGPSNLTLMQQPKRVKFSESSFVWTAPRNGVILSTGGHMHDGGTNAEIYKNNEVICNSVPTYSSKHTAHKHDMKRQVMGDGLSNTQIDHIQKQEPCVFKHGLPLKKGDKMRLRVNYDFTKHPGMKNKKGELDLVMGIAGTIIAFDKEKGRS